MSEVAEQSEDAPKVGRPLMFRSVEELDQKINEYFESRAPHVVKVMVKKLKADGGSYWAEDEQMSNQRPVTITGLAVYLGTSRRVLLAYKDREEYLPSIEWALARCEEFGESQLFEGNANGAKFSLQNNYGWVDKQIQEHEGGFFNAPHRLEVEIVNPEVPAEDETQTEPDAEPSAPPAA